MALESGPVEEGRKESRCEVAKRANMVCPCGGVDTRGAMGEGCQTVTGCGQRDYPTGATPNGAHTECQVWPQLRLSTKGGRSRASCPMDGVTVTGKYLLLQIPTTFSEHLVPGTELHRHP